MSCEKYFRQKLRDSGFRLTPQREVILAVLHQQNGFKTVEEIYSQVSDVSSSTNISTVYRTLELLYEFGLVTSVDSGDRERLYRLLSIETPHLHLVCEQCGRVFGVDLDQVEPMMQLLTERYGFEVKAEQLSLPGLCMECRQRTNEELAEESARRVAPFTLPDANRN